MQWSKLCHCILQITSMKKGKGAFQRRLAAFDWYVGFWRRVEGGSVDEKDDGRVTHGGRSARVA